MTLLYLIGHKYSNVSTEPVMTVYSICLSKTRCFFLFFVLFCLCLTAIRRPQDRWERLFAGAPFTIKKGTSSLLFLTIKFNLAWDNCFNTIFSGEYQEQENMERTSASEVMSWMQIIQQLSAIFTCLPVSWVSNQALTLRVVYKAS